MAAQPRARVSPVAAPADSPADLVITNARVYTLAWDEPDVEGHPAPSAPVTGGAWHPDAQAIAIRAGRIVLVGSTSDLLRLKGARTQVIDAADAVVVPGLVDAHVHLAELGASLERVNLVGVRTEAEAVDRVVARARQTPKGEWIVAWGWDEGAWAAHYPDMTLLSERVPDHPAILRGLHSFAVWGNRLAFARAGITASTPSPEGGEIRKAADGTPTGVLLNNAARLLERAIPQVTPVQLEARVAAALKTMAEAGYVAVHEAGADSALMGALESLDAKGRLPIRVYAMLAARDEDLIRAWQRRGPDRASDRMLVTRAVKAFYDGALGSRGAFLLDDYSDRSGHRGTGGAQYGFRADLLGDMMRAGFQIVVHAIGDRANRETLDFFERAVAGDPAARAGRHRIEHAQVVSPADVPRFAALRVLASMQPPHVVEDKAWCVVLPPLAFAPGARLQEEGHRALPRAASLEINSRVWALRAHGAVAHFPCRDPAGARDAMSFCEHCEGQRFDRARVLRILRATRKTLRQGPSC